MKVSNMRSSSGKAIANQIVVITDGHSFGYFDEYFVSYGVNIVQKDHNPNCPTSVYLDRDKWNYWSITYYTMPKVWVCESFHERLASTVISS